MKKLTYLLAAAAVFAACNSGNKGYTVTGTVEGAADGDTVYLQTAEGRQLVKLDSAVITNGTFTFKGTQDSAVNRYITCQPSGKEGVLMDFFLENGAINIKLTSGEGDSATGTANKYLPTHPGQAKRAEPTDERHLPVHVRHSPDRRTARSQSQADE